MVRVAEAEKSEPTPEETLMQRVRAFLRIKMTVKSLTEEGDKIKKDLSAIVEEQGDTDEDGSQWLNLPSEVDDIASLKRERRVSRSLNQERAVELLTEKGLFDRVMVTTPVVDEEELMACVYEELLTADEVDSIYDTKVTYAFVPSKKSY